jgi:hypothetical protein
MDRVVNKYIFKKNTPPHIYTHTYSHTLTLTHFHTLSYTLIYTHTHTYFSVKRKILHWNVDANLNKVSSADVLYHIRRNASTVTVAINTESKHSENIK